MEVFGFYFGVLWLSRADVICSEAAVHLFWYNSNFNLPSVFVKGESVLVQSIGSGNKPLSESIMIAYPETYMTHCIIRHWWVIRRTSGSVRFKCLQIYAYDCCPGALGPSPRQCFLKADRGCLLMTVLGSCVSMVEKGISWYSLLGPFHIYGD